MIGGIGPGLIGVGPKAARELYIGNLPPACTIPQLNQFMNTTLKNLGVCGDEGTVISSWINESGHFAFVELRTIEESNDALIKLSGMQIGPYQVEFTAVFILLQFIELQHYPCFS